MRVIKSIDETLFIEFDDENANTTISGVPVIFMSKKTLGSLLKGMIGALGEGARPLLYLSGYIAGQKSAPVVIRHWECKNLDEKLSATIQQFARYGWLLLKDIKMSEDKKEITCLVEKSFESQAYYGKSDTSICYFLKGFLCGYMEIICNKENMICEEVTCQAKGDTVCQFVIKPKFWKE
ncbi:MAG: XylR N-terminal domain-containing protein [ANME-2 cluster archaeon]|nr:XylR N-terminal domain-containing protein [ANME-2 cluster archaeon]